MANKLSPEHPLRAFLDERRAWLALDDWHVTNAVDLFESAIARRRHAVEQGNRRALFFIFFDQQAIATAERLRGNLDRSRQLFEELINALSVAMSEKHPLRSSDLNCGADISILKSGLPTSCFTPDNTDRLVNCCRRMSISSINGGWWRTFLSSGTSTGFTINSPLPARDDRGGFSDRRPSQ